MPKKILLVLFAIPCSLMLFEFFLSYSPFAYGLCPVIYDADIGMWHKSGFTDIKTSECYKTSYSFDDKGLPKSIYKYNPKKKDIIILGDSFTEALMVKNENIIHNALARVYRGRFNFLNYGLSGSSPTQQFVILKKKINLSNIHSITQLIFVEGDLLDVMPEKLNPLNRPKVYVEFTSLEDYKIIPPRAETITDSIQDFTGNFQIYTFIKKLLYFLRDKLVNKNSIQMNQSPIVGQTNLSKNWLYLKGAMYQINKIAIENNISYKPIIISNNDSNIHQIKTFMDEKNIEYIILVEDEDVELNGFDCDPHWNDATHISIANYLRKINFFE